MASDVTGKAAPGTLWKQPKREKTPGPGLQQRKPLKQVGKAAKGRAADRRAIIKAEPATHEGLHYCYIGAHWMPTFDLEHVLDASTYPELARDPRNHRKACNPHNIAKKDGTLTEAEEIRVQTAIEDVLYQIEREFDDCGR